MQTWTLDEARAALAEVAPLVERLRDATAEITPGANGQHASRRHEVATILARLHELGIVVRDPAQGLIDFPARSPSGRAYFLCWLAGEPDIEWWHWIETGLAGRTPLATPPG